MSMAAVPTTDPDPDKETGINSLTAAESAMAERKAGQSITTLGNDAFPQVALIGALGWVLKRRSEQRLTYEAYMQGRKVSDISRELGLITDDDDDDADDPEPDGDSS